MFNSQHVVRDVVNKGRHLNFNSIREDPRQSDPKPVMDGAKS